MVHAEGNSQAILNFEILRPTRFVRCGLWRFPGDRVQDITSPCLGPVAVTPDAAGDDESDFDLNRRDHAQFLLTKTVFFFTGVRHITPRESGTLNSCQRDRHGRRVFETLSLSSEPPCSLEQGQSVLSGYVRNVHHHTREKRKSCVKGQYNKEGHNMQGQGMRAGIPRMANHNVIH